MAQSHDSDQLHLIVARAVFHSRVTKLFHHRLTPATELLRAQARQQPRGIAA
jgi:hypothetical protein